MTAKQSLLEDDLSEDTTEDLHEIELSDSSDEDNETKSGADDAADAAEVVVEEPIDELKRVMASELSTDTTQYYLNQIGTRP